MCRYLAVRSTPGRGSCYPPRPITAGFGESLGFLSISDPDAGSSPQTFSLTISDPASDAVLSGVSDGDSKAPGLQLLGTAAEINAQLDKSLGYCR